MSFFLFLLPPSCHTWCQATCFVSLDDETLSTWKDDDDIKNTHTMKQETDINDDDEKMIGGTPEVRSDKSLT